MERFTLCVLLLCRCVFTQNVDVNSTDDAAGINAGLKLQPNRFGISFQSFPGNQAVNENCAELLQMFRQTYVTFADCLLTYARPVRICQNCFMGFKSLEGIYRNISTDNPGNGSCLDSLVRSDRLMLLYSLYSQTDDIWTSAGCKRCLTNNTDALSDDALYFLTTLNQSLSCFEKYVGNHSELCKDCKASYTRLNEVYARKEKNHTLCIDLEDSMNMTRQMWSKSFGCSFPREETVPVLAVSSFMLFLPIIFYLSSFLHSEQKKRKLIHPSRVKTSSSLMNIQDKSS